MDSLLQEITMLPGVLGCFVFTNTQGIIGSKMPPIFKENNIKTIGSLLARTRQLGMAAQLDFSDMEIKYNESMLLVKPITKGSLLVIISEPNANKSLIVMTCGMMLPDLETAMKNPVAQPKAAAPIPPAPAAPQAQQQQQPPPQAPPKEAEIGEELAPILEEMRDALALAIGPIAPPVMRDTIEIWAQQGPTTMDTLPALVKLLCEEINDAELEKEFMDEYRKILS